MLYRIDPERVLFRYVDGETVLINTETSYYYSLNRAGTLVWKMLIERGRTSAELLRAIQKEYSPPKDVAARDLESLLNDLRKEGLVIAEE